MMGRTSLVGPDPDRPRGLARIKAWVHDSPWWAISIGLHVIVFLVATLVYIEKFLILDEGEIGIEMASAGERLPGMDRPPVLDKEKPPAEESHTPEEALTELNQETAVEEGSAGEDPAYAEGDSGKGKGLSDLMGVVSASGTGRPGAGGARRPSRPKPRKTEPSPGEEEVRAALKWLARHQSSDGSWSATRFSKNCGRFGYRETCAGNAFEGNEQYDVGVTALALLAFLGAGHSTADRDPVFSEGGGLGDLGDALGEEGAQALSYGEVVKRAIRFLIRAQGPSGLIGPEVDRAIYNHTISTLALAEAYGETGVALVLEPVEKALRFLVGARSAKGGWRYSAQAAESDASVTGWVVLAFHAAELAGIAIDRSSEEDLRRWFDRATVKAAVDPRLLKGITLPGKSSMLLTGYLGSKDAGKLVSVPGLNDGYGYTPALTATMVMATLIFDGKPSAKAEAAAETLLAFLPPRWNPREKETWKAADFYYWFHATYALAQLAGADDERWKRWCDALKGALLETQNLSQAKGECREGSWDPVDRWSCEGGRVYATAIGALTLEARYRSPRILAKAKPLRPIQLELR